MGKELNELYHEVDRQALELAAQHADRLQCHRGCCSCCIDEITVFEVEAENIRLHYPEFLARHTPHPLGACAFLDDAGACRIYPHRPYVCRTQGLPLRWIDELPDGAPAELRDICPLNESDDPIETLPSESCWTIGPFEGRLAELQSDVDEGQLRRVLLRSLFQKK
jgi:uncharacterized protein